MNRHPVSAHWSSVDGIGFVYVILATDRGGQNYIYVGETGTGIFQRAAAHFAPGGTFTSNLLTMTGVRVCDFETITIWNFCLDKYVDVDDVSRRKAIEALVEYRLRHESEICGHYVCRTSSNSLCNLSSVKKVSDLAMTYFLKMNQ